MRSCLSIFIIGLTAILIGCQNTENVLTPVQNNKYTLVYQPKGDTFFGPSTQQLKEGVWYDNWVPNDHTFVKSDEGKWHIFGITHPMVDFTKGGIHQGEYASFHAISSKSNFDKTIAKEHYQDLPKVLTPKDRPDEVLANHAPYIVKKDKLYYMVYGHSPIRLAISKNLYDWELKGSLFEEEKGARDPNLLLHNGTYYITYCSEKCVRMRSSKDLINWSASEIILNTPKFDPESPSLIFHNDTFYLFVCVWKKEMWDRKSLQGAYTHQANVYQSNHLNNFGTGKEKLMTVLNAHAPEIFKDETGQWYISSVVWPYMGVSIDKLEWKVVE